jgi:organic radical activating enzyme
MTTIPIHERFLSFQGEGQHAGRKAFFIRTLGCPVHCPWCDSAGTWHKDFVPEQVNRMPIPKLAKEAKDSGADFAVITGGEPCVHGNLHELATALKDAGMRVHLETCGGFYQESPKGKHYCDLFDFITVSPKAAHAPLATMLVIADEIKIIVDSPTAIARWMATIDLIVGKKLFIEKALLLHRPVWLHPEWSQRENRAILDAITTYVSEHGDPFRAGWQLHKLFKADSIDPRSAAPVPLGGDINKGY